MLPYSSVCFFVPAVIMVPIGWVYHLTKTKLQHIKGHISSVVKVMAKEDFHTGLQRTG